MLHPSVDSAYVVGSVLTHSHDWPRICTSPCGPQLCGPSFSEIMPRPLIMSLLQPRATFPFPGLSHYSKCVYTQTDTSFLLERVLLDQPVLMSSMTKSHPALLDITHLNMLHPRPLRAISLSFVAMVMFQASFYASVRTTYPMTCLQQ